MAEWKIKGIYKADADKVYNEISTLSEVTEHYLDEKLMSSKRGAPVLIYLNRFSGWSEEFDISYLENVYSLEQLVNAINLAGFGIGIGSGRTSGYGRYHVENVR